MLKTIQKFLGDPHQKEIKRVQKIVDKINEIERGYQSTLTDDQFKEKTAEFKARIKKGETTDDLLPEAFALVKAACLRLEGTSWKVRDQDYTWDMPIPYDVQLIGGITIHEGKIAEMRTGEGKTLVSAFPVYLNALEEKGVFVVTVNDYLAERDAEWMSGLHEFLGLTIGIIHNGEAPATKRVAYAADVTYGTNNEFGFDYLRDNMARKKEDRVQRKLNFAIIDEVDSILIDEARTPLIISAPAEQDTSKYGHYSSIIHNLTENEHYNIDEKARVASLSESGITKLEELLGVENIYTDSGFETVHHIEQALRAKAIYKRDQDYVVKDNQVMIVDEFTGRLMSGRRFGQGLHQAIEAKEKVQIRRESRTLATITFQNYFRMFKKLAGMTGTALTEEEEFLTIYGLNVLPIPTHRPIAREDKSDVIYKNINAKFKAIAQTVKGLHEKGQPVLVGTVSVEKSEALSRALKAAGVPHKVLNAKHHEHEAEIVAKAGQKGSVTIATNMAGRGTDIKLGAGVKELGGLYVIGSERHESRRIDNQLRGRSGRQGDPGFSQFYVSMEDDLMRIFGGLKMQAIMEKLNIPEDLPIENGFISRNIESAQKRVEGKHFDVRKHLVEYDGVMNTHRDIIYQKRNNILDHDNLKNEAILMIENTVEDIVLSHPNDLKEIHENIMTIHRDPTAPLAIEELQGLEQEALIDRIKKYLENEYAEKENSLPNPKIMRGAERHVMLRVMDMLWMRHITELRDLKDAVSLSGHAQKNPLIEYKNLAFEKFEELVHKVRMQSITSLFHVKINVKISEGQTGDKDPKLVMQKPSVPSISMSTSDASAPQARTNRPAPRQLTREQRRALKRKK
jgi:preprotein translocase subunit SecA